MLEIKDFSCRYRTRKKETLSSVSLSLAEGDMVLLAGKSGCGKSTLIKAITGLLGGGAETDGQIWLDGRDALLMTPEDIGLLVGAVYQTPDDQLFAMTVADEVGFALENRGEAPEKVAQEVALALEKTGLSGFEARSIHALSGGQRQRLALASVLVTHPRLLILDEPVSQMNPQGVTEFLALLRRLHEEDGMTILVAEHRVNELAESFPRLALMHEGRFVYDGPTEDAWKAVGDSTAYGLREPQTVRLSRQISLPVLTSDIEKTAAAIRASGRLDKDRKPVPVEPQAPREPFLVCENLHYTYQGAKEETLHGLSFTLGRGGLYAIMGENGAGKSTLMNLLAGLEAPSEGRISLGGVPMTEALSQAGYMRQEADLMLLTDSVAEEISWKNDTLSDEELDSFLRTLRLRHYKKDFPPSLSKGQRLRCVFGAILARRDHSLLLLDEPTTGQDQDSLSELKRLLQWAAGEGRTVLFITHDTEMAADIADAVLLLSEGKLLAFGAPHEILSDRALLAKSGLSVPPMLRLSEELGLLPCITVEEVAHYVL